MRELEVMRLLAEGLSNREITVESHVANGYAKIARKPFRLSTRSLLTSSRHVASSEK
jgi:hypothetical protein